MAWLTFFNGRTTQTMFLPVNLVCNRNAFRANLDFFSCWCSAQPRSSSSHLWYCSGENPGAGSKNTVCGTQQLLEAF